MRRPRRLCLLAGLACALWAQHDDPILRPLRDEVHRSRSIRLEKLEPPYFIEVAAEDAETFGVAATLGALVRTTKGRFRAPRVQVRVGDYTFDNTNYVGSGSNFGVGFDADRLPLDNAYPVLRRYLWLAADRSYKSALEAIARKSAALKSLSVAERLPDFARAEPVQFLEEVRPAPFHELTWTALARSASAVFARYPVVRTSGVELEAIRNVHYLVNTEGTEIRYPERLVFVRIRARGQAPDGMMLRDAQVFHAKEFDQLAGEVELARAASAVAENLAALATAPMGELYSGPVLFEREAAPQWFAQVLGKNLVLLRRPVMEPGRPSGFPTNELEGRLGSRILPEWIDVVDDPTQTEWRGRTLLGHYKVDMEGVAPKPLVLVEKGVLKSFLLTRQPQRGFEASNGHARMPGAYGANQAGFGNLFVRATQTVTFTELRKRLVDAIRARGKPYGLLIRRLDYPSSATFDELRRQFGTGQGSGRLVSPPILAYKLYADGREELVRGLRFRGLNTRALKDIVAASDESHLFEFLDTPAPLALMGAGGYIAEASVVAPSILVDDLELEKIEEEFPKLPIVPPPS